MSAEDIAAYREQHNSDPIKAVVFCQSTPYGTSPIDGTIYLTDNQAREMTTDSMREVCVERSYSKARYVESFATARSLAGIEATVPNEFAVCVSEADPTAGRVRRQRARCRAVGEPDHGAVGSKAAC